MTPDAGLAPAERPTTAAVLVPPAPPFGTERDREPGAAARRVLDLLSAWLPLLLMGVLALGSWWLVENTPLFETDRGSQPVRHVPDYTMTRFLVQRFAADGKMTAELEGAVMRHYPDTETIEIEQPRIRSIGKSGEVTVATARSALTNKDASEIQLSGDAHIVREATATEAPIDFRSEFLHYLQATETVRTHRPVVVTQGTTEVRGDAMVYDNLSQVADFKGRVRAVLARPPRR